MHHFIWKLHSFLLNSKKNRFGWRLRTVRRTGDASATFGLVIFTKCTDVLICVYLHSGGHTRHSLQSVFVRAVLWSRLDEQAILHVSCYTHRWEHTGLITGQWSSVRRCSTPPWLHKPVAPGLEQGGLSTHIWFHPQLLQRARKRSPFLASFVSRKSR